MSEREIARLAARLCATIAEHWTYQPDTWTQHSGAVDCRGISVVSSDPRAVAWCAIGIVAKAARDGMEAGDYPGPYIGEIQTRAIGATLAGENRRLRTGYTGIHQVNDFEWKRAQDGAEAFRRAAGILTEEARTP
jgi:hypothetical protein